MGQLLSKYTLYLSMNFDLFINKIRNLKNGTVCSALVYNYIKNAICGYSEQENGRNLSHSVINKGFKETTLLKDNPSISNVHDFIKNGIFSIYLFVFISTSFFGNFQVLSV